MGSDEDLTWRTFRREIWWVVLLFPVTWAAIWVFNGEDLDSVLEAVGISVLMAVILGPLVWVRWARRSTSTRRNLRALGLAVGRAVLAGGITAIVRNVVD
jgi:hypothetical protein